MKKYELTNKKVVGGLRRIMKRLSFLMSREDILALSRACHLIRKYTWKDVNNKLPEEDGYYLVTVRAVENECVSCVATCLFANGEWGYDHEYEVIAWMDTIDVYERFEN